MGKALIHELGKSKSYGRLSLLAKVLWPMLLASSDDQGRGQAEADVIKWYICPNVVEITQENIPHLLEEMKSQGMLILYDASGENLYQVVKWWEYQKMQWAHPSKYDPPEGWTDRLRYNVRGGGYFEENWKDEMIPADIKEEGHVELPPDFPPENQPGLPTKLNLQLNSTKLPTKPNLTEPPSPSAKAAKPSQAKPKTPTPTSSALLPDTPEARIMFARLAANAMAHDPPRRGPKRFSSLEQKQKFIKAATRLDGHFEDAIATALEGGITSVKGVVDYIAKWQPNKYKKPPQTQRNYAPPQKEERLDERLQREEVLRQLGRSS